MLPVSELALPRLTPSFTSEEQRAGTSQSAPHIQTNSPSSSAIFHLPNELLCCIFTILFDLHLEAMDQWRRMNYAETILAADIPQGARIRPKPPWSIILHVCRLWRSVSMANPSLWKTIYTRSPGWMAHFLTLSLELPLDFNLRMETEDNLDVAELIGQHSERIRMLSIYTLPNVQTEYVNDCLNHFLGEGASKLRSLKLEVLHEREPGSQFITLSEQFFSGRLSHLETLFVNCPSGLLSMQMDCPAFKTLTSLSLRTKHSWQRNTMDDFLLCLQTWTQLREISLACGLPTDVTEIPLLMTSAPIALPSIETISFYDKVLPISNFLARVSLRPESLHLDLELEGVAGHDFLDESNGKRATLMNLVTQANATMGPTPPEFLEFWLECDDLPGRIQLLSHEDSDPQLDITFHTFGEFEVHSACFQTVLDGLRLSQVKKLVLSPQEPFNEIDWSRLFRNLTVLEWLKLPEEGDFDPLIRALGTPALERRNDRTGHVEREVCLPTLHCLEILPEWIDESVCDLLVQSLKNRMEWGSPLPLLRINREIIDDLGDVAEMALTRAVLSFEMVDVEPED